MKRRIDTLGGKIGLGYGLMTLTLALAVIITIWHVEQVKVTAERLGSLREPTAEASQQAIRGLHHSTASLRGWMLAGHDGFKADRAFAWRNEIRAALDRMAVLSRDWTNPANVERLHRVRPLIQALSDYQDEIEVLTVTDKRAARKLLDSSAADVAVRIRDILKEMTDDQARLMQLDLSKVHHQIRWLSMAVWALLGGGVLIGILLAFSITRSIARPLSNAVRVAQEIGTGNFAISAEIGGSLELERLGRALTGMRDSLRTKTEEAARYAWLTSGQNRLNDVMRGDKEAGRLADEVIAFLATSTGASVGALYLDCNDSGRLVLAGRYALDREPGETQYGLGEGLVGQAGVDRKTYALKVVDDDEMRVRSAIVDVRATHVIAVPFLLQGRVLGVVELGGFEAFDSTRIEFVEANMDALAIAVNSANSRERIRELLEETQRQSEALQQQQEELEQTNEELEEQAQKLKEQQEELQATNEELEEQTQVVEQKNSELETARTDIELKAKQLEISSRYKSEFLANMSHELRTPLNSLLILANDLLKNKQGNLSDDQVESAEVIARSGSDLLVLINEILDLSKIEAGHMDLNVNDVRVSEIARDIRRSFRPLAEDRGLKFDVVVDDTFPDHVRTDRQRLEQIVKNLIGNAIKFTESGGVSVSFRKDAGGFLAIAVEDSGIGIAKDQQEIVFEAFQQVEGGPARRYGGTGLGLSISRELAKILGGRIALESTEGQGSTFTLIIPADIAETQKPRPERSNGPGQPAAAVEPANCYIDYPTIDDQRAEITEGDRVILIIEDDRAFASLLARQADEKGFRYLCAATGEDGLRLAAQFCPQAIILDIDLPGIDGHLVLKELKGNPDLRHIPVHIMSVNEKTLDPIRSGAVTYLTKPVSRNQLDETFDRIEDCINRKMKNLLIVEDDEDLRNAIVKLIGNGDVQCFPSGNAAEALDLFAKEPIDCVVLDIGLPDMSGFELIKAFEKRARGRIPPIIVYTGRELSRAEHEQLREYSESIIVKGIKSEERLLDETALFLHRTVSKLPRHAQSIITDIYDKEKVFHDRKVLLVDDDMRNVFALGKVLRDKGMKIIKAENGKTALEALDRESSVGLVLMDIMMPEMDGFECMRQIRQDKRFDELPIIALTAKAMKEDRLKCIEAGANDYISKPVDVERLLSLMRIWISK